MIEWIPWMKECMNKTCIRSNWTFQLAGDIKLYFFISNVVGPTFAEKFLLVILFCLSISTSFNMVI